MSENQNNEMKEIVDRSRAEQSDNEIDKGKARNPKGTGSKRKTNRTRTADDDHAAMTRGARLSARIKQIDKRIRYGAVIAVGILALIVAVVIITNLNTITLSDYITVTYYGANGYAGADCAVDNEKLYQDLAKNEKDMAKLTNYRTLADSITAVVTNQNISNGSAVSVTVSYDVDAASAAGVKVKSATYSVRASGISAGVKIDLYSNVSLTFAGISPDAYVVINNQWDDDYLKNLVFTADTYSEIEKDQTITLSCSTDWEEIARHGYIVSKMQAEYKADQLSTYVENVADLDQAVIQNMVETDQKMIQSETESKVFRMLYKATKDSTYLYQPNDETAADIQHTGTYFLSRKDEVTTGTDNYIYILYQAEVSNSSEQKTLYFAFEYSQGYLDADGTFDIAQDNVEERYTVSTSYDELYDSLIQKKSDLYNVNKVTD